MGCDGGSLAATVPTAGTTAVHSVLRTIEAKSRIATPSNAEFGAGDPLAEKPVENGRIINDRRQTDYLRYGDLR